MLLKKNNAMLTVGDPTTHLGLLHIQTPLYDSFPDKRPHAFARVTPLQEAKVEMV